MGATKQGTIQMREDFREGEDLRWLEYGVCSRSAGWGTKLGELQVGANGRNQLYESADCLTVGENHLLLASPLCHALYLGAGTRLCSVYNTIWTTIEREQCSL